MPLVALGQAQHKADQLHDCRSSYQRALTILETHGSENDPLLIAALTGLAEVELAEGNAAAALPLARRATQITEATDGGPRRSGPARFVLARALAKSGAPAAEARAVATLARDAYTTLHDWTAVAEVDAWLLLASPAPQQNELGEPGRGIGAEAAEARK